MATELLNPNNPSGATVVDNSALMPPGTSGQDTPVGSLEGTMTAQKAEVEPAVVSSTTARKQVRADQNQLASFSKQLDEALKQAQVLKAEEAKAAAEAEAKKASTSSVDTALNNLNGALPTKSDGQLAAEQGVKDMHSQLSNLQARLDTNSANLIQSIKDEYASLERQQAEINKAYEAGVTTEGFRSGRARYAPLIQGSIITGAISAGLTKISDIVAKKNRLVMEAEAARDEKNFKVLTARMQSYRDTIKEEREAAQEMYENTIKASQEARAQLKAEQENEKFTWDYVSTIAPSVADEVSKIEDPVQRSAYLMNLAQEMGVDSGVLFGEVQKYTDDNKEKKSTGVMDYEYAVSQGFKGSMLQYRQAIAAATRAPKAPNTLTAYEAANLGLPKTMVGMSEAVITSQLNSSFIPVWFKEMNPGATEEDWNAFRLKVPTTGNTIEDPFAGKGETDEEEEDSGSIFNLFD